MRMINKSELLDLTGLSYPTISRRERVGSFPCRVRVGPNAVAWRLNEVAGWVEARPRVFPTAGGSVDSA